VKTLWQYVLQEPPQELDTGNSHDPPSIAIAVLSAEGHVGFELSILPIVWTESVACGQQKGPEPATLRRRRANVILLQ
jgi:hypothetical protein